jgi:hypothetical protein
VKELPAQRESETRTAAEANRYRDLRYRVERLARPSQAPGFNSLCCQQPVDLTSGSCPCCGATANPIAITAERGLWKAILVLTTSKTAIGLLLVLAPGWFGWPAYVSWPLSAGGVILLLVSLANWYDLLWVRLRFLRRERAETD